MGHTAEVRPAARKAGPVLAVIGAVLFLVAVAVPSGAVEHPDHCGGVVSPTTQATGVTTPDNGRSPAGNNGTVKIDGCELDHGVGAANDKPGNGDPDNEPHIGCLVTVDWYGFDAGNLFSDVTFQVWPPTGGQVPVTVPVVAARTPGDGHAAFGTTGTVHSSADPVYVGEDDATGGGSAAGIDASVTYDMTSVLSAFEPHPQHGWHVKLTVETDGSRGADVKHKVFWTGPCETPVTTTTAKPTTTTTAQVTTTTKPTTTTTQHVTTTTAPTTTTTGPTTTTTAVSPTTTTTAPTTTTTAPTTTTTAPTTTTTRPTTTTTAGVTTTTAPTTTTTTTPTVPGVIIIPTTTTTTTTAPVGGVATTTSTSGPSVGGVTIVAPTSTAPAGTTAATAAPIGTAGPSVLGVQLARTGAGTRALLMVAGLLMLAGGVALTAASRKPAPGQQS